MQKTLFEEKPGILDGLNEAQKKAVTHETGPLLIIAGAGTGKTTVITRRIAYLIEHKLAKPSEILALTFTEKAAAEMEERVDRLVPYGYTDMWISTFHAFGDRILRDYTLDLGLPANFNVLSTTEQAIFMKQNIFAFDLNHFRPISNPTSHIKELLTHFSRLKDELITSEQYLEFAQRTVDQSSNEAIEDAEKSLELAKAYERYQELMLQAGNLDFGDQLFLVHNLLKSSPKILDALSERFKFILVDEFQDTNYAQSEVVKLLAAKYRNITVVGDDDQSIYRFRGASISNILAFTTDYPDAKQIVLNDNYRSTQEILDAAYRLIQHNNPDRLEVQNEIDKHLVSPKHGILPELIYTDTLSLEADTVTAKIQELHTKYDFRFNDFAILMRANSQAAPFVQSLNVAGIPSVFSGMSSLFERPEVKMLIAFLKSLVYDDDLLSFYQLITSELYNANAATATKLFTVASRSNRAFFDTLESLEADEEDKEKIEGALNDIRRFREKKNERCGEVLYEYLKENGYLKLISDNLTIENELKINNIAKFFDRIGQFDHASEERNVIAFVKNIDLLLEMGDDTSASEIDPDFDAVNILTAHSSKGLEYKVVFIINCVAERFPMTNRRDQLPIPTELLHERLPEGDFHLQEERRLFYVAATRAKDFLFLCAGENYGGKRLKKLSVFVNELLDNPDTAGLKKTQSAIEKIERWQKIETTPVKLPNKFLQGDFLRLNVHQLDDYYTCPKKFLYAHIIKFKISDSQQAMYGTAVHGALNLYFQRRIRGEKTELSQLLDDFDRAFENRGFISREHEELRHEQGRVTLSRFFDFEESDPDLPAKTEESFELLVGKTKISGRYDLIYIRGDEAEIRDFKTSDTVKTLEKAVDNIKGSTQMRIYALAWREKYGIVPKTTLYYIEHRLKGERVFTDKELEKTESMIEEVTAGIRANNMTAVPSPKNCRVCSFSGFCTESEA